ncbi:MAG TPA: DUF2752 domain-containing protein [Myxococcales bacterium]|jgi:hypothetical protein|nr:DUF2752 domain-containing protein [Myxococcales bacterium]
MRVHWPAPNRVFGFVDAMGITGAVGLLVARFIPVARLPFWGCAIRRMTGWPCPGCGLTRVADRMSHFHFAGAWDANPMGTVAAALFMVAVVATVLHMGFKVPMPEAELSPREWFWLRTALAVLVVVNYAFVVVKTRFPFLLSG